MYYMYVRSSTRKANAITRRLLPLPPPLTLPVTAETATTLGQLFSDGSGSDLVLLVTVVDAGLLDGLVAFAAFFARKNETAETALEKNRNWDRGW